MRVGGDMQTRDPLDPSPSPKLGRKHCVDTVDEAHCVTVDDVHADSVDDVDAFDGGSVGERASYTPLAEAVESSTNEVLVECECCVRAGGELHRAGPQFVRVPKLPALFELATLTMLHRSRVFSADRALSAQRALGSCALVDR